MSLLKTINDAPLAEGSDGNGPGWYVVPTRNMIGISSFGGPYKTRESAEMHAALKKSPPVTVAYGQEVSTGERWVFKFEKLPEPKTEGMSLMQELSVVNAPRNVQTALKQSDGSDAGANDVVDKAKAGSDVSFNLMRNTINASGKVSGSDVANYIEKAEDLNDEVDTVPFGLETDDGQIVKVYVNAEQADQFEEAMKNMLGLEDDIEEAINRLTTEFDIVDVVWPRSEDDEDGDTDADADLSIDDTSNLQLDDEDFADDNYDVVASATDDETKDEKKDKKKSDGGKDDDEITAAAAEDEAEEGDDTSKDDKDKDEDGADVEADEDAEEPDEEEDVDPDGNPIPKKKKKKKKAQPAEPVEDEDEPVKEAVGPMGTLTGKVKIKPGGPYGGMKGYIVRAKDKGTTYDVEIEGGDFDGEVVKSIPKSKLEEVGIREERVADSPSIAAAIKKMTSQGLHISAMDEDDDNTVFIEDDKGEEYVMRGDKKLTKEKHGKKLTSRSKRDKVQETTQMTTFGSKFLERVLQEAPEDKDGVKDGFNIPLDSQARALTAKLKLPFAKRLIAFHVMAGVPGRYLNTEDAESSISGAADMLRKKVSVRRAFMALYDGLANAKGFTIPAEEGEGAPVKEEKKPIAEAGKPKRGSFIQKLFETVLVELGLPQDLITSTGPSAVGTGLYRTAELIEQDGTLERALRLLATRLGVRSSEAQDPVSEAKKAPMLGKKAGVDKLGKESAEEKDAKKKAKTRFESDDRFSRLSSMAEAVDVGNDDYAQAVADLVSALGIPDDILERRRTQIVQALRAKKQTLKNRQQVLTMIGRLKTILDNNTQTKPNQQPEPEEENAQ